MLFLIEQGKLSGQAARWAEAVLKKDFVSAEKIMEHNSREIAVSMAALASEWNKWRKEAGSALIPVDDVITSIITAGSLLRDAQRQLLVLEKTDSSVADLCEQISTIMAMVYQFGDRLLELTHHQKDSLGPIVSDAVFPHRNG